MVDILATVRRPRSNRRRPERNVTDRFARFWRRDDAEKQPTEDDDRGVVPPRLVLARVFAWLGMVLCVALLATLVMSLNTYSTRTRQFQVREFKVIGNHRLDANEVIAATGVTTGNGLFKIDVAAIRQRLEELPWVRQAWVHKQLPARLVLQVEEYVPVVLLADGGMLLVDDSCHLIGRPRPGSHQKLPVVTGISLEDLQREPPNASTLLARRRLRRAIGLIGSWPHSDRFALGEVNWNPVRGITLLSAVDGAEIRVGHASAEDLRRRFSQIDALLAEVERRGRRLRYALLDDPTRPGQAVIRTADPRRWNRFPQLRGETKPAGPSSLKAPQAAGPGTAPELDLREDQNALAVESRRRQRRGGR
jgi:cell division protein FtsQ